MKNYVKALAMAIILPILCFSSFLVGKNTTHKEVSYDQHTLHYFQVCYGGQEEHFTYTFPATEAGEVHLLYKSEKLQAMNGTNRRCEVLVYHEEWDEILFYKPEVLTGCEVGISMNITLLPRFKSLIGNLSASL